VFLGGLIPLSALTKAALICGSGSMIILISILINLPFFVQIILLLCGLAVSVYGVSLLVKMVIHPVKKESIGPSDEKMITPTKKKKRPSSTL
jgi:hypothetical protein